jgi:hypothetical protein
VIEAQENKQVKLVVTSNGTTGGDFKITCRINILRNGNRIKIYLKVAQGFKMYVILKRGNRLEYVVDKN